jgi:hypothetical protein
LARLVVCVIDMGADKLPAEIALGADNEFATWPVQYGWWLDKRQKGLVVPTSDKPAAMRASSG